MNRNAREGERSGVRAGAMPGAAEAGRKARRRPLKVLMIGHQFQVPSEGQAKAAALAKNPALSLHVLTPARYREAECRWRYPQILNPPEGRGYELEVAPVNLAWVPFAKWYLQWYPALAECLARVRPDVIDIWEEPWGMLSAQVCFLRNRICPGARIISETEQNVTKNLPPPFEQFRAYTLRNADFVIGRNAEALSIVQSKGFEKSSRVVGNGVDTDLFRPMDREAARRHFGISGFAVGYAGRLVEEKGLLDLVAAVRDEGAPQFPKSPELWLSGAGPMEESLAKTSPRVHCLGSLKREDLPAFYNALDVLVLPSHTTSSWKEQFGRVLIEAQACGIPVLGSDSGAIPEVIADGGLIFKEGDVRELRSALHRLCNDPQTAQRLAQRGRERALTQYGWAAIANQMSEIYFEVSGVRDAQGAAFPKASGTGAICAG